MNTESLMQSLKKKRLWLAGIGAVGALAATLFVTSANASLKQGDKAPDFSTQGAMAGKTFPFVLSKELHKGPVVLYFFPAAFTSGCTQEAHEFAEASEEFTKMGGHIFGVSADPIDKLARFSEVECRNKFAVGVATPQMISSYGVKFPLFTGHSNRTSFLIGKEGKVRAVYSNLSASGHVAAMREALKAYNAAHSH
jgi:thioredoxin-dependent peroxiredoxin